MSMYFAKQQEKINIVQQKLQPILENVGDIQASQQLFFHFSYFRQQYLLGKPDRVRQRRSNQLH